MCASEKNYLHEVRSSHDLYQMWMEEINLLDRLLTTKPGTDQSDTIGLAKRAAALLFPVVEAVSINIFGGNLRKYLKELGYSSKEANLMYTMFRNGFAHYNKAIRLEYDDGIIRAEWHSVSGSAGFLQPFGRKAFTYYKSDPDNRACLELHWFASQIKSDLESRLSNEENRDVNYVIGQKIEGHRPSAEELREDDWV